MLQYVNMKWTIKEKPNTNIDDIDLHSVIEQLLLQRGIKTAQEATNFFEPDYNKLNSPFLFEDMNKVVSRVKKAIEEQEIVGVFGDHDADGVSSTVVLVEGLEKLGLNVDVYIPDKVHEGHGLNKKAIDEFIDVGVSLMFTVDCGTSNIKEVDYANNKNIDVIITDHHHAPKVLPDAYAIVNPQLPKCKYPFKYLSGTAVAFKVVQALFQKIAPEQFERLKWLLDVVCVGTIADCMPLVDENRILVNYGLIVLSKTQRLGYREMIRVGNVSIDKNSIPSANTVAFQIAPRINAAGRMSHAKYAYELMRETNKSLASKQAKRLEKQNLKRRELTEKLTEEVERIVKDNHTDKSFILITNADYPVGIVGIIAGRIAQKYGKPTGIFTKFETESRGSFRSVEGLHILDVLNECKKYLYKFGGHEQAAGAIIKNDNFDEFCNRANDCVFEKIGIKKIKPTLNVDCEIEIKDIDRKLANQLQKLEPFGEGNEEPSFVLRNLVVNDIRTIGSDGTHLKMKVSDINQNNIFDAIAFGRGYLIEKINIGDNINVVANIQENKWMGNINVQLNIVDLKILNTPQ